MFGGGSTQAAEQQADDNAVGNQANSESYQNNTWGPRSCEVDAKQFTKCLDENQGNMQICGWYLEQLVGLSPLAMCETLLIPGIESLPVSCESILGTNIDLSRLYPPGVGTGASADQTWKWLVRRTDLKHQHRRHTVAL